MAQGNIDISNSSESNSDDEKPCYEDLAKTFMFFEEVCTKQKKQLKELKSKLASSTSTYIELVAKFEVFTDLNVELTSKINKLGSSANIAPEAPKKKNSIFDIPKKDASTSCIYLIELDLPMCNYACVEDVITYSCSRDIAMENEYLKQDVVCLTYDLVLVKGKTEQIQPHRDNTVKGVKKLNKGALVPSS
jgi:hypothetical protein